ncbi:MAG: NADH-quinone oxidoreductase subunit C [Chloroflexi bacterium]|nr:NADH-quinone oxidoreductase subunit C [Chloroflexota bacterium]MBU1749249.1 NADH-quinone oxidoreductase subunit C [Chloroflexota bacterium]
MDAAQLIEQLKLQFGDAIREAVVGDWPVVRLAGERLPEVGAYLKDSPGLDMDLLVSVTAVDYEDHFETVYHLRSIKIPGHRLVIKVRVNRQNPVVPSLTGVWQSARLQEREVYDFFGIHFEGHPNLKRLFLWEQFPGYPLRKDFRYNTSIPYSEPPGQEQVLNV